MTHCFDDRSVGAGLLCQLFVDDVPDAVQDSLTEIIRAQPLQLSEQLDQEVGPVLILRDQCGYFRVDGFSQCLKQGKVSLFCGVPVTKTYTTKNCYTAINTSKISLVWLSSMTQ